MIQKLLVGLLMITVLLTSCTAANQESDTIDNLFAYAVDLTGEQYRSSRVDFLSTLEDYLESEGLEFSDVVEESPSQSIYRTLEIAGIPVEVTEKIEFQRDLCIMISYTMIIDGADWPEVSEAIVSQAETVMPEATTGTYESFQSAESGANVTWGDINDETQNSIILSVTGPEMMKREAYYVQLILGVARGPAREAAGETKTGLGQ